MILYFLPPPAVDIRGGGSGRIILFKVLIKYMTLCFSPPPAVDIEGGGSGEISFF